MISFLEVIKRSLEGPICSEMDFDLNFGQKLREIVTRYGIKYDPDNPVPNDDRMADDLFQAGLEFYEMVGTYCTDSQRVIQFSRNEILEALATAPSEPVYGDGKDAKRLIARPPESDLPPWCFIGASGAVVTDEKIFSALVEAYGLIPFGDSITTPAISSINGYQIVANSPLEILGSIRAVKLARDALRKAGRPGMPIMNCIATAGSDAAKIAGSQFGLRPSDGWMIATMAEMKINFHRLNEVAFVLNFGGHITADTSPFYGGYCGGAEGVAVANVAYHFLCMMVLRGSHHNTSPMHFKYITSSNRELLWAISASNQAITRNSHFPLVTLLYLASGAGTQMVYQENAANVITALVSGGHIEAVATAKAEYPDYLTPLEPKFSTEIARASIGMKRDRANEIVKDLLNHYESKIPEAPKGKRFQDCFNIETLEPNNEDADLYEKMKDGMKGYGVNFVS